MPKSRLPVRVPDRKKWRRCPLASLMSPREVSDQGRRDEVAESSSMSVVTVAEQAPIHSSPSTVCWDNLHVCPPVALIDSAQIQLSSSRCDAPSHNHQTHVVADNVAVKEKNGIRSGEHRSGQRNRLFPSVITAGTRAACEALAAFASQSSAVVSSPQRMPPALLAPGPSMRGGLKLHVGPKT